MQRNVTSAFAAGIKKTVTIRVEQAQKTGTNNEVSQLDVTDNNHNTTQMNLRGGESDIEGLPSGAG